MGRNRGVTLIELLIVVAIIAILAAIAIPNFLAAQIRAKVSRSKAEMQSISTALESYYIDNNAYPRYFCWNLRATTPTSIRLIPLSTPIAYMSSIPRRDPFGDPINIPEGYDTYDYVDEQSIMDMCVDVNYEMSIWGGHTWGRGWRICGIGPDRIQTYADDLRGSHYPSPEAPAFYDPSNGTVSNGDIIRFGGTGQLNYGDKIVGQIQDN
jgi:prepilin-type N-terminal cleavage/methylation domain-containing protein